ncbi:hypothetical protein D3C76_1577840 [compost metagenome]
MSKSHRELARIIQAEKDIVFQMSQLIAAIPDRHDSVAGTESAAENAAEIAKSITMYLSSLADLEEAIAQNLTYIVPELSPNQEE